VLAGLTDWQLDSSQCWSSTRHWEVHQSSEPFPYSESDRDTTSKAIEGFLFYTVYHTIYAWISGIC